MQIVRNSGGPAAAPGDVIVTVTGNAPLPSTFNGSAGTAVTLNVGAYSVAASQLTGYTFSTSGECAGNMTLGASKTCTLIFDDDAAAAAAAARREQPERANQRGYGAPDSADRKRSRWRPAVIHRRDRTGQRRSHGNGRRTRLHAGANFNGADSFTFKINDAFADSNVAAVTITVLPANDRADGDSRDF